MIIAARLGTSQVPPDLALLAEAPEPLSRLGWALVAAAEYDAPDDHSYLRPEELRQPAIAANIKASRAVNACITYFAEHEDHQFLGYWRGTHGLPLSDCPVVLLDNEGQYSLAGRTVAEFILLEWNAHPADQEEARRWFRERGIDLPTVAECFARIEGFEDPSAMHWRLQGGGS